ncbi:cytochrome P450 [Nocardia mexicana]|uniref:Cytochrome P450 n=1 Tax=Nocardia mexicana TaxID=279262 RepID=A0A370GD58_9NOCA|nr:cytochrome P450 [Nocardia mexicana]RDI41762.1 hypothetical protein DFR68_13010 [Nocardia mexicana]
MLRIFDRDFARDPWPMLRSLRNAGGVHRVETPDGPPAWLVTRFEDVRAGLLDDRLTPVARYSAGSDYRGFAVPAPLDAFQNSDPDDHARIRRVVVGELRPRRLGEWTDAAAALVRPNLRRLDDIREFDFVGQVAVPLPAAVLGELLGLSAPVRESLLAWANSTLAADAAPPARDTLATMGTIITAAIEHARRSGEDTMLGRLARADGLSSGELASLVFYLLFVWYEVLVDVVAGAVLVFSAGPDRLDAWLSGIDRPTAVDELLRYLSPQVLAGPRFAMTDIAIGEYSIAAGDTVLLCLAAANRDPEIFDMPDELDLRRSPNPQLSLGYGIHACAGTGLVRPVLAAVLDGIYAHWPKLRVTVDAQTVSWRSGFRHRGPLTLPVTSR